MLIPPERKKQLKPRRPILMHNLETPKLFRLNIAKAQQKANSRHPVSTWTSAAVVHPLLLQTTRVSHSSPS